MVELSFKEVSSRGGKQTLKLYGNDHFSKLGKISAEKRKAKKTASQPQN